jgi:D-lactate dehydrogenase
MNTANSDKLKIVFYSTKPYDKKSFEAQNSKLANSFELSFYESSLKPETVALAKGANAVCAFVNDDLGELTLEKLSELGIKTIALRCAGFNNVSLITAKKLDFRILRVPAYSPAAVAEHALALLLCVNRHLHKSYTRVREGNFMLNGLVGFDLEGKTIGVVGTGKIGQTFIKILQGFGAKILAYDVAENDIAKSLGAQYVSKEKLFTESDVISLHCPLLPGTFHLINAETLSLMKKGVVLINTSRGGIIDTNALIENLKSGHVGAVGLDVYEEEDTLFFRDLSNSIIQDDVFARLISFPNVLVTGHQAFLTKEALHNIAETTLNNLSQVFSGIECANKIALS